LIKKESNIVVKVNLLSEKEKMVMLLLAIIKEVIEIIQLW